MNRTRLRRPSVPFMCLSKNDIIFYFMKKMSFTHMTPDRLSGMTQSAQSLFQTRLLSGMYQKHKNCLSSHLLRPYFRTEGNQRVMPGNTLISTREQVTEKINGITARTINPNDMPAIGAATKRVIPTGGVIIPVTRLTHMIMAK